jgi:calcium/calmodulin-dependent protein kinase I
MKSTNRLNSNNIDSKFIDFEFIRNSIKFEKDTLFSLYLKDVFEDLSSRDPNQKGISKLTFTEYVKLPVFISEKLFSSLDKGSKGYINEKEFTQGFTKLYLGNFIETAEMIFKIMDFDKDGLITRGDVKVLLSYLPLKASETREIIAEYKYQMKSLEELDRILTFTFGSISKNSPEPSLSLEKFIDIITKSHSDIYIHLLCFLYQNKPFQIEKVNSYKLHRNIIHKTPCTSNSSKTITDKSYPNEISIPPPKNGPIISTQTYIQYVYSRFKKDLETEKYSNSITSKILHDKNPLTRSSALNSSSYKKKLNSEKNMITIKLDKIETNFDTLQGQSKNFTYNNNINTNGQQSGLIKTAKINIKPENLSLLTDRSEGNLNNYHSNNLNSKNFYEDELSEALFECNLKSLTVDETNSSRSTTSQGSQSSHRSIQRDDIRCEDYIFMPQPDKSLKKLYMVLIGKDIILYTDKKKDDKVIFQNLSGCFIKDYTETYTSKDKTKYYQFKIVVSKNLSRHFLVSSEDAKVYWIDKLKIAIGYQNFFDYYTLQDDIDEGKFGKVKIAVNKSSGEKVAVKVIKKDELKKNELEMLKNELDLMKLFRHPNIVSLLDHFENENYMFIVMEHLSGGNLSNYLIKMNCKLTEKQVAKIINAVAQGIKYINSFCIIHRDLKPENIMFSNNSDKYCVKIIDFGLSKILSPNEKLSEGMGTLRYVSPEVLTRKPYNKEVDVWSLGVIMFLLLSGNGILPFDDIYDDEETIGKKIVFLDQSYPKESFIGVSKEALRLIDACLAKKIENRITILELLKDDWVKANSK